MLVQSAPQTMMTMSSLLIDPARRQHHAQLQHDNDASERPKESTTSILELQGLLTSYLTSVTFFNAGPATY
jgi:hypothetical protein